MVLDTKIIMVVIIISDVCSLRNLSKKNTDFERSLKMKIGIGSLCMRQIGSDVKNGEFGGFCGSVEDLQKILNGLNPNGEICVLRIPADERFLCTHDIIRDGDKIIRKLQARRKGEQPVWVDFVERSHKAIAQSVALVLYSRERLANQITDPSNDYELVSINCSLTESACDEPMSPTTLWRNYWAKDPNDPRGHGGTYRKAWDNPLAFLCEVERSNAFWSNKARVIVK